MSTEHWDLDQDNTLGGNSPSPNKVPSQKALKEYIDSQSGGGGGDFIATYGTTTYQDVLDAYNGGKNIICRYTSGSYTYEYQLYSFYTSGTFRFIRVNSTSSNSSTVYYANLTSTGWSNSSYSTARQSIIYGV